MIFTASEEQRMAIDGIRKLLDNQIEPEFIAHGDGFIPRKKMQKWTEKLAEFGVGNTPFPVEYGGLGLDWVTHGLLWEEVGYTSMDIAIPLVINAITADLLVNLATDEIKDRYLPDLLAGKIFGSFGISEPDVGSDVSAVRTRAVRDGDHYIINGEKTWISNGEYSDFFICTCLTDEGLSHILIDREEHEYETRGIPKMALNGQSTAQIFMTDVRVPVTNIIGDPGKGLQQTLKTFERARCHMGLWGVSIARRAMDEAIKYSQDRVQHGKQIAGHQLIADKIATMATEIDAARLLAHRGLFLIDENIRCDKECAMAKWYGTEIAIKATRDALQIHGANGVTKEFIVERLVREAIISTIPDGTTEIQKLLIARSLTGVQAFS